MNHDTKRCPIMPPMAERQRAEGNESEQNTSDSPRQDIQCGVSGDDRMICERCGKAEMYRMHAVWRCPECGFKTDCCGW